MDSLRTPRSTAPQLWRMMTLVEWLKSGRRFQAHLAAEELQVTRRTIQTDLDHLRDLGVPLAYDAEKRSFVLTEDFADLPALRIKASEWAAIALAERVLEAIGAEAHARTVQRVVERIQQHFPNLSADHSGLFSANISFLPDPGAARPIPWLADLERAVRDQLTTSITYYTLSRGTESTRLVDPYHVLVRGGHGYLIAWCHTRGDVLIFRTDRVRRLAVSGDVFLLQGGFDLAAFLGPMFGVFNDRETVRVKVRFSSWVARWIREEVWHPSQTLTDLPDGSVQLDMDVTGLADVKRWVLGFGAEAEVVEPQSLRQAVLDEWRHISQRLGEM